LVWNDGEPILKITDLSVSYGHINALKHVAMDVNEGEIVVLIGSNGAGKTTVLETVLGLNRPDTGDVLFRGKSLVRKPVDSIVRSGLFLVPEGRGVFSSMSVSDNLLLGAHHNMGDTEDKFRLVYEAFPVLEERKNQVASTLSGGERQMLAIGRALMSSPELIMIDEPSLGLAPLAIKGIFDILARLNSEGYTILLSEQNAYKALKCAHRGYVLETGTVVLSGSAEELLGKERVREAYLGA